MRNIPTAKSAADQSRYGRRKMAKTATQRHRRVAHTQAWRARQKRGAAIYPVEVDGTTFNLLERFGGLETGKTDDKRAVAAALGRLWHRALAALVSDLPELLSARMPCGRRSEKVHAGSFQAHPSARSVARALTHAGRPVHFTTALPRRLAVIMHRIWVDGTRSGVLAPRLSHALYGETRSALMGVCAAR